MRARPTLVAALLTLSITACGGSTPSSSTPTPVAASTTPTTPTTPTAASGAASPSAPREARLVINAFGTGLPGSGQVRLTRLDAADVGVMTGQFIAVAGNHAIALNGLRLTALDYQGRTSQVGTLTAAPAGVAEAVVVSPDLSQWLYTTTSDPQSLTAQIRLGSASGDRVVATLPSPNGNGIFAPFAWSSGVAYLILQATGIGGAGPFLDYRFPVYRLDLATGAVSPLQPPCLGYDVLASGTVICALNSTPGQDRGGLVVRAQGAQDRPIPVTGPLASVTVSPDQTRLALAGLATTPGDAEYQVRVAQLAAPSLTDFGPPGYVPEAWLPDGRLVANRTCLVADESPTKCDHSMDGSRYILSADGSTSTFFYKLAQGAEVVGALG